MPGSFKTEAIVLRSIRYGEADRILHLYSRERGRIGAVAKGVRRPKSRFGGRLEPLFRVEPRAARGPRRALHGHLGADRARARRRCARAASALARATEACEAVLRLFDSAEPNVARLQPALPRAGAARREPGRRRQGPGARRSASSCCWRPGFVPELASCASCGEREHLGAFSAGAGGVVCAACEAGSFPLDPPAHEFLVDALARPLAEAPEAAERALAQADRAIAETLEHHAHVRLGARSAEPELTSGPPWPSPPIRSSSTTSPRARGRCASCSAARARTSPR